MKKIIQLFILIVIFVPQGVFAYGACSEYGIMATEDFLSNKCKCMSGYVFGKDFSGKTSCVLGTSVCYEKYGYSSQFDYVSNSCECSYGHAFAKNMFGEDKCISVSAICRDKLGIYGRYSSLNKSCECEEGYTIGDDNQCKKKQNNVYFFVKDLDTDNKQAILKSNYDSRYYYVNYGVGCYSFTFNRYLLNNIVVNLGTDYDLDILDKIVLQDDNETCDIMSREKVDSSYKLNNNTNINYILNTQSANNSVVEVPKLIDNGYIRSSVIYCNTGYIKDILNIKCIKDTSIVTCGLTPDQDGKISMSCSCSLGYKWIGGEKCQKYDIRTGELIDEKVVQVQSNIPITTSNSDTTLVTRTLKKGISGSDVVELQTQLKKLGYLPASHVPSKNFGSVTQAALIKFQKDNKISPSNGIFGPVTQSKLLSVKIIN